MKLKTEILARPDLTMSAKLLYAVLVDRMGTNGECWPGVRRLAADCAIGTGTVVAAVRQLVDRGLLVAVPPAGTRETTRYRLPERSVSERSESEPERSESERNQTKLIRSRVLDPLAAAIYDAYPRKVGRAKALTAIAKALADILHRKVMADPAGWLLERVRLFAASPAGQAGQYTPHPATWFNQGRYDDDEREWSRDDRAGSRKGSGGLPKLAEVISVRDFKR